MTEEELKFHEKVATAVFLAAEEGPAKEINLSITTLIREVGTLTKERDTAKTDFANACDVGRRHLARLEEVEKERDELQALIDKQHTRVVRANKRWQEATKQFMTWPDLGKLVDWLLDTSDAVEKENAQLKAALKDAELLALETMHEHPAGSEHSKAYSALFARTYDAQRTPAKLYEENLKLKALVREHRDQLDDDRCWLDDEKLYAGAGLDTEEWASALPPKDEFLANCTRYHASRQKPEHPYVTVDERIKRVGRTMYNLGARKALKDSEVEAELEKAVARAKEPQ